MTCSRGCLNSFTANVFRSAEDERLWNGDGLRRSAEGIDAVADSSGDRHRERKVSSHCTAGDHGARGVR